MNSKQRLLLCLIISAFLVCACDKKEEDSWTVVELRGIQDSTLVLNDLTRVIVTESFEYGTGFSLIINGRVEFNIAFNTQFFWPELVSRNNTGKIVFTGIENETWGRLRVNHDVVLEDLIISDAVIGIDFSGANKVELKNTKITNCQQYGVYAANLDSIIVEDCQIEQCLTDGLHIRFSNARVNNLTVSDCVSSGIYSLESHLQLRDSNFLDNGLTGASGTAILLDGVDTYYDVQYCLFRGNYYSIFDTANRDAVIRLNQFENSAYFPLLFAHPHADRVLMEQNNILPGPGGRRVELATTGSYREGRYLPAENNWWGSTDESEITQLGSFIGDGRTTANSDTIRVNPILLTLVLDAGPRQ